jgi:hypothetical protein
MDRGLPERSARAGSHFAASFILLIGLFYRFVSEMREALIINFILLIGGIRLGIPIALIPFEQRYRSHASSLWWGRTISQQS